MLIYDHTLPTDRDWVRFLTGDVEEPALIHDDEIDALITSITTQYGPGAWVKYFAAAQVLTIIAMRWRISTKGVTSKSVSKLSISFGSSADSLDAKAAEYLATATGLLAPKPAMFSVFRTNG